jgi:hypothetical protein
MRLPIRDPARPAIRLLSSFMTEAGVNVMGESVPEKRSEKRRAKLEKHIAKFNAMNLPTRKESLIMMFVTGIYLIFEVSFGARLLDVVGSTTDLEEIEQIENAGRLISGIALTLVVWTAFILPRIRKMTASTRWRKFKAVIMLSTSTMVCCMISYTIQEAILDGLSYGSNPAQRQAASTLTLVSSSVQNSMAVLRGIDFDVIDRKSPESKTFMALLPSLALSVDRLEERTRNSIEDLLTMQAESHIGPPEKFYAEIYFPTMNALKESYNEAYLPAAIEHEKAILAIPVQQNAKYQEYVNSLRAKGVTPRTVPSRSYSRVRSDVRLMGVPVSLDWSPRDRQGFVDAIENKIRDEATPPYDRAMREAFGETLPDNLDGTTFFKHEVIQKKWRDMIGMDYDIPLDINLDQDQAVERIYRPWVKAIVNEKRPLYFSSVESFEEGGEHYEDGISAIRVAYIPLIAFGFSLFGALVHSFKTMNFAIQSTVGHGTLKSWKICKLAKKALLAMIVMTAVGISNIDNDVTNSELFTELETVTENRIGSTVATSMRTVIQLQPFAYPVAEALRNYILQGLTFDFDPETDIPVFERIDFKGFQWSLA